LRRSGLQLRKKVARAAEQGRPDVQEVREQFAAVQGLGLLDPDRLVFLDETAATTNMTRRYGRAPVGERLVDDVPFGHYKRITLISALRSDGLGAGMTIDGSMTGDRFVAYVEQVLLPELRVGDVVILDNLSAHKRAEARELIEGAGCSLVFLPAYSPDLNPIENAYSKLKALLRKAKQRTVDGLHAFLFGALDAFKPQECANFFSHCGYSATSTS
jgi:transposase